MRLMFITLLAISLPALPPGCTLRPAEPCGEAGTIQSYTAIGPVSPTSFAVSVVCVNERGRTHTRIVHLVTAGSKSHDGDDGGDRDGGDRHDQH